MIKLIDPVNTHMYLTQATGSSPIVKAYEAGSLHVHPVKPDTMVTSIAIGNPADGYYALMVVRQSGGSAQDVSDQEAIEGMKLLAETEGIFAEAAGGVVIAGLKKLVQANKIQKNQLTVACITGAGPRTQEIVSDVVQPIAVKPSLESFNEILGVQV